MARATTARTAIDQTRTNNFKDWNKSPSSSDRSANKADASNRVFDNYAVVEVAPPEHAFSLSTPVFAMGSCFAREIELVLTKQGGNVISIDDSIKAESFKRKSGREGTGFFHRFTPNAMLLEFQRALGEAPDWKDDTLVFPHGSGYVDLNYWHIDDAVDVSLEATLTRRKVATALVRKVAQAEIVVLTLGLTESFIHLPTGCHANRVPAAFLMRNLQDFSFHNITFEETVAALEETHAIISRHRDTPFEMVVTVSPVPLSTTFSGRDIIIANMDSKSTLRAAAARFCNGRSGVHYFPSYEMVMYSRQDLAWRPDRVHIDPQMVKHIVSRFMKTYFC